MSTSEASKAFAGIPEQIATSFTGPLKHNTYPAISPSRPELSQAGKTVLITGGATGIGYATGEAFALASAARIILVARRPGSLDSAVAKLKATPGHKAEIIGRPCDISDFAAVEALWTSLEKEKIVVDVLVLSAVRLTRPATMVELGHEEVWREFETNVHGNVFLTEKFIKHIDAFPNGKKKALLNVSTMSIHDFKINATRPTYSATKNTSTLLTQLTAAETPVEKVQIVSYHPGAIYTENVQSAGYPADLPWDDVKLPGHFGIWAASLEAAFLHGRFVWAGWDVEQLMKGPIRERIESNPDYLKIGVIGMA
ncbi:short chain dehydrogenase [Mytilinidion resinicola]|uniref:Short chain dehydrogenase n=1 Tax=Mytilinidion resinicola TaxID=574789 RepID=A0A6A6YXW7_9PEZI|nr:short chain dehydrogenase [Mytilinidion resinicola]KAF2813273.1 short chain dehydrogenase [Mytilinidion resinicola]